MAGTLPIVRKTKDNKSKFIFDFVIWLKYRC